MDAAVPRGKTLWARTWPNSGLVDVAVDRAGNTFVAGVQGEAVAIDSLLLAKGGYVICFGPDGSLRWAKQIPGSNLVNLKVATDPSGAFIYISALAAGPPAAFRLDGAMAAAGRIFVMKVEAATGTGVWANSIALEEEMDETLVDRIATNGREVVVAGRFAAKSLATTSGGVGLTSSPERGFDGFLVGFTAENGLGKWASRVGGSGDSTAPSVLSDRLSDVQVAADGEHFLVAGGMAGDPVTATTGGAALSRIGTNSNAFVGSFVAVDGTVEWSRLYGGTGKAVGISAASSSVSDLVYFGGWISGQVDLGTDVAAGNDQGYVLAMDTSHRSTRWSKLLDGVGAVCSVRTDDAGDLMAYGSISKQGFSLEGIAVEGEAAGTTSGAFVAKWSSSGELLWLKGYGSGDAHIVPLAMVVTPSGGVRMVGLTDHTFIMSPDEQPALQTTNQSAFVIALAP
ncbi:cell surface protein [Labilithrix luteola]|uniref:Cell surface protein n=1 Tax=Labilithrix luteola TaxID=1391654 RepID=A0A0K1PMC1_9BACT|nr:cell surface protein [Labilithrix luteola]